MEKAYIFSNKLKKIIAATLLVGCMTTSSAGCAQSPLNIDGYTSVSQMNKIAADLGCDMDNMLNHQYRKGYPRLLANDGPVLVTIDEELKEYNEDITGALDTIFNLVHNFNAAYTYEIVDESSSIDPTTTSIHIKQQAIPEESVQGCIANVKIPAEALFTENVYIQKADILIDIEELLKGKMSVYACVLHELGHVFGLGDVYQAGQHKTTDKYVANTMMNVYLGYKIPMFTTYDVSRLAALYIPDSQDQNELNNRVNRAKVFLREYSKEYYDYYTETIKDCINNAAGRDKSFSDIDGDMSFVFETSVSITYNEIKYGYNYRIECDGNGYCIEIYDKAGNLLDQCRGGVVIDNGILVLKDVELKGGLRPYDKVVKTPDGYIQDLTLFSTEKGIHMYDAADNNLMDGTVDYLDNDLSLD